ncbi:hypothetical protein AUJ14_00240 [Candidatus Micrarchaeota archaeon CG1_02_55_22]|nr:MAG: hypothetical protein AUJ14_00240 [Candidatus Micrarchaeota archaeon CG1_02_55_22]
MTLDEVRSRMLMVEGRNPTKNDAVRAAIAVLRGAGIRASCLNTTEKLRQGVPVEHAVIKALNENQVITEKVLTGPFENRARHYHMLANWQRKR